MPLIIKMVTIPLLWATIGFTVTFGVENIIMRIVLILIAIAVTVHISLIRPRRVKNLKQQ